MVALQAFLVFLPLLFFTTDCAAQPSHPILLKVIDAIEKLIRFYKTSYQDMNLDGIFGLKVVEGQVQNILDEHGQGQHTRLSPAIIQRLQTILQDTHWIAEQAVAAVRADDEGYFQNLAYVITQPWSLIKHHRKVVPARRWEAPVYEASKNSKLDEQQSDKCMMEITMSGKGKAKGGNSQGQGRCNLTKGCAKIMTSRGLTDYGITHQLLWTALAEKAGCGKEMNALLMAVGFNSTDQMQEEFCTNNYYEMLTVVHVFMTGKVHSSYQDMFMEQQFVCPNLGFFEFLKKDYLDQILSWQLPSGCFGEVSDADFAAPHQDQDFPPGVDPHEMKPSNRLNDKNNNVDLLKKEMEHRLNNLNSNNLLLESVLKKKDSENGQKEKLHEQLQHLNRRRNAVVQNQAAVHKQMPYEERRLPQNGGQYVQKQEYPERRWVADENQPRAAHMVNLEDQRHVQSLYNKNQFQPVQPVIGDNANRLLVNFPSRFENAKLPDMPNRLLDRVPVRRQVEFPGRIDSDSPYRLKGNFPILAENDFPDKHEDSRAFRAVDGLHRGDPRLRANMLNNLPNRYLETDARLQNIRSDNRQAIDSLAVQKALRDGRLILDDPELYKLQPQLLQGRPVRQEFRPPQDLFVKRQPGGRMLNAYETGQGSQRKLLVEKNMPGGCLAHKTGVACGALAMYLRYLVDPGPLNLFASHDFYPDSPRGAAGDGDSFRKVMTFIGQNLHNIFDTQFDFGKGNSFVGLDEKMDSEDGEDEEEDDRGGQNEEEEEEDEEEEEYKDKEEMYSNKGEGRGQQQIQNKKVFHFGANEDNVHKHINANFKEDDKGGYVQEKEEEEEGADYIRRVKGDNEKASKRGAGHNRDAEYTYYDENDKAERGNIKKHKPKAPPHSNARIHVHVRHKSASQPSAIVINGPTMGQKETPPTKALVLLLSATSLVLIIFMCKFMKKRRIHFKYGNRPFLKL